MYPRKGRGFGNVTLFSIWLQWLSFFLHTLSSEESGHQKQHEMHAGEIGEKCTPSLLMYNSDGLNALCIYNLRATGGLTIRSSRGKPDT